MQEEIQGVLASFDPLKPYESDQESHKFKESQGKRNIEEEKITQVLPL